MGFFSEYNKVFHLLKEKQQVVFYAESRHYFQYFEQLIQDLLEKDIAICYITSDANDPLLVKAPGKMNVLYVKWLLGFLFSRIRADVMIMTMPDLGNYLFKRSAGVGCYIYIFHAAVSTHQQYSKAAFFNYDAVFCTGEYQEQEIRAAEKLYGLREKDLVAYGYPLLDQLKKSAGQITANNDLQPTILVAPSWFEGCIFDTCIEELLLQLSLLQYRVVLRSHPEFEKRKKKKFRAIQQLVSSYPGMTIDTVPNVVDRLQSTDILITDRSGIAFEFAFGIQQPVLFIDTVPKVNNKSFAEIGIEPIENIYRNRLGISVDPEQIETIPEKLEELRSLSVGFRQTTDELAKNIFFNAETAYRAGCDYVIRKLSKS